MRLCNHQCTHAFCTWHMIYVWQLDGIWPPISWSLAAKMDCGCKWKVVWLSSHLWLGWSFCFIWWPQHLRRLETTCPVSVHLVCNLERASQMARELRGTYFVTKEGDKVGDCRKPVFLSFFFFSSHLLYKSIWETGNVTCPFPILFFPILEKLPEKLSTSHVFASSSTCRMLLPFWNTPHPWYNSSEVMP